MVTEGAVKMLSRTPQVHSNEAIWTAARLPFMALPTIFIICIALGLRSHQSGHAQLPSASERRVEIAKLRVEIGKASARLKLLQNAPHPFLPRGTGAEAPSQTFVWSHLE